jgi:lipid A 3-O-deacylase
VGKMKRYLFLLCFVWIISIHGKSALISLGGGWNDILREKHRTGIVRIEYKFSREIVTIRPLIGMSMTYKKALYVYGGFFFDWLICNHLIVSPNFAAGYYDKGDDKDLGFPIEFRSGIEGGWCFSNDVRIGAHFYHISNASLGHKNPGTEALVIFLAFPFF